MRYTEIYQLIEGKSAVRTPSLLSALQLAPNSLVFDKSQFFRTGNLIIKYLDGTTQVQELDSYLISKMKTYHSSVILYHSLLSSEKSGQYLLIESALRYFFCEGNIFNKDFNPIKKIETIQFQFLEFPKISSPIMVAVSC